MRGIPLPAAVLPALCLAALFATGNDAAAVGPEATTSANAALAAAPGGLAAGEAADSLQAIVQGVVDGNPEIFGAVLLVDGPYLSWRGAAGLADPAAGRAMAAGDQFYLASVAKTMTAALVLKLAEAGRVGLDDPVADYLPDSLLAGLFTVGGRPRHGEVTLRQLLGHTAGVADAFNDDAFIALLVARPDSVWTPRAVLAYTREHQAAHFAPGEGWRYSDNGYNLLGLVVEAVTGSPLTAVYRDSLLDPLGMRHTFRHFAGEDRQAIPGRPPSHWFRGDLDCTPLVSLTSDWAGGGLYSTAEDLRRFLRALFGGRLFARQETLDAMRTTRAAWDGSGYGLGIIRVRELESARAPEVLPPDWGELWGHIGASSAFMYYWPERDTVFAGTMNQMRAQGLIDALVTEAMAVVEARAVR